MTSQFRKGTAVKMAAHRNAADREAHKGVVATGKVVMRKSEHPNAGWADREPFVAVRWDDSGITTFEPVRRLALLTVMERADRLEARAAGRASGKKCSARIKVKVKARCACSGRSTGTTSKAYDAEILAGMSHGPWAIYWANREEERGRRLGQVDIYDAAPRTPAWAVRWARDAAGRIVKASRAKTLTELYERAQGLGFRKDAERFGLYLSAQFTGEGISWTDDVSAPRSVTDLAVSIPHGEFYQRPAKFYSERY